MGLWQQSHLKLNGVGPVDNRPSIDKLHHIVKKQQHVRSDMWNVTCDMWHVIHDMWHVVEGKPSLKMSAP